jgi:hypothetical protein
MNKLTKNTVISATGVAAAALMVGAFAAPAMASTGHDWSGDNTSTSVSKWYSYAQHSSTDISNVSPVVVAPEVSVGDVLGGGILNGDILDGNAVASGNDVTAPIASGNDTAIGSGNDTAIGNNNGNGNSVSTDVSDLVDNTLGSTVDVNGLVDDIMGSIDLGAILGR